MIGLEGTLCISIHFSPLFHWKLNGALLSRFKCKSYRVKNEKFNLSFRHLPVKNWIHLTFPKSTRHLFHNVQQNATNEVKWSTQHNSYLHCKENWPDILSDVSAHFIRHYILPCNCPDVIFLSNTVGRAPSGHHVRIWKCKIYARLICEWCDWVRTGYTQYYTVYIHQ